MTKYIKQRLSVKIFIITFFLLGTACSGTYFFISKLLPVTYSNLINVSTEKAAMHLVEQMTAFDNISDCENDISNFSKETNAAFWIEDSNGRMIYPAEASMETSTTSADYTVTFDEDESFIDMQPSGETTTNFYPFTLKNGTAYALAVQTDLFVVQQATKVLLSILPYVILMVFLLSLLCAWLYTRYITRPIVQLSKISKQMAELDFSGQCGTGREDELGCLAQNLNSLSASLSTALNDLQTANQQLKTDIEKEQELERQRVDFFSAASHELKTPLTVILSNAQMLAENVEDPELRKRMTASILTVSQQMKDLVTKLLSSAQVDQGIGAMQFSAVDLSHTVSNALLPFAPIFYEQGMELDSVVQDDIWVQGSQPHLIQVVNILLDNAQKYGVEHGHTRVTLRQQGKKSCLLTVANEGKALSGQELKNIFKRFYRADAARERTGSYGLGLSIAEGIVQAHRGKIWAESKDGVNTFLIQLPTTSVKP